ncbi:DUF6779 domain-containing protein [Gordonia sp. CPCC 205515]|uniref:DUF6779 domain-containing protein n=1 Tax=Gordonia sp. CPCC 205515 TaxID=3140791 RepID=UPI003AF3AFCB
MSTPNARSEEPRRSGRSAGQWLLGLLIVLAIVASILMVFSDQLSVTGSLAVIAALWAAVIGAILVTKFRRQAESAESKSRDLRLVYELQLEREIAARRQYELDVETTIRKEVSAETGEEISELKAQVMALRASLEMLLGESLPDPRVALPSEKLRELASGIGGTDDYGHYTTPDDSMLAARDFAATAPATDAGRHLPTDVDPNELTEVIPVITDDVPISGRIATESVPDHDVPDHDVPDSDVADHDVADQVEDAEFAEEVEYSPADSTPAVAPHTDETPTDEWASAAVEPTATTPDEPQGGTDEDAEDSELVEDADGSMGRHESAGDESPSIPGRRRRRAADDGESAHSAGLPVSELLSQLRDAGASSGRRRRED